MIAALFCREDSAYKKRLFFDVYDINRDAKTYTGNGPAICHPPCRSWGQLSHMSNPREGEKELAPWSLDLVRRIGGIVEHPKGSRIWKLEGMPPGDMLIDSFGGFTVLLDQRAFGHVAHKMTRFYICGISIDQLPEVPDTPTEKPTRSICGNVKGTKRCTQYQREYTPELLIDWLELICYMIIYNKTKEKK